MSLTPMRSLQAARGLRDQGTNDRGAHQFLPEAVKFYGNLVIKTKKYPSSKWEDRRESLQQDEELLLYRTYSMFVILIPSFFFNFCRLVYIQKFLKKK